MAGVYGDSLLYFSELYIDVSYYNQIAKIGAGYTPDGTPTIIRVIRQTGKGFKLSDVMKTGSENISSVLNKIDNNQIWYESRLEIGWFIGMTNGVYRIKEELDWLIEAGFYGYTLEKIIGNDGTTETTLPVQSGVI